MLFFCIICMKIRRLINQPINRPQCIAVFPIWAQFKANQFFNQRMQQKTLSPLLYPSKLHKHLFSWFLHRRRNSMSKLRQFRTTWDDSGQFGTKCCAIIVGSKRMVPVYPFTMNFCPLNGFHWMPNSPSCTECSARPAESHWYPARRKSPPESWRTMSHDAAQCRKTPKSICAIM